MENIQFFLPINNQYTTIDLPTLKSNNYKTPTLIKRKRIDMSPVLEIAKYNNQLIKDDKNKEAMIENFGMEKYLETMDRIDDEDKIILTRHQILPRFLQFAKKNILREAESLA